MTAPTFNKINAAIARNGVELVKGEGYFYFAALDGAPGGIEEAIPSVYSMQIRCMTLEQWIEHVEEATWNWQNEAARAERRKVSAEIPIDPEAHPFSGRAGDY